MDEFPKIISVDDHVVEPANLWTDRLPAAMREAGPRMVLAPQGDVVFVGPAGVTRWNRFLTQLLPLTGIISNAANASYNLDH